MRAAAVAWASLQPLQVHVPRAIGEEPTTSKATAYESAPFVDRAWDASAAVGRLKTWAGITGDVADATPTQRARFAKGFAGVRGDGSTQGDYVLPHHDVVDGRFVTIPAGVSAALGRVDQTDGFSSSEHASMRRHLEQHRDAWQAEESKRESKRGGDALCLYQTRSPGVFRLSPIRMLATFEEADDEDDAEAAPRSWIQVARIGKYKGHPQGDFEFTPDVFKTICENFKRTINREVPVDFEHATELPGSEGSIPSQGAPATGFILELRNGGQSGLFGLVEWLEPGLSYVRAGRYRRFSPAVQFDAVDPVTAEKLGPMLTSGALTNRPFLDGMTRLAASAKRAA